MLTVIERRAALLEEARAWIDTPWVHQGRTKGVGVDCVGLVVMAARAAGIDIPDSEIPNYGRWPHQNEMRRLMARWGRKVEEFDEVLPGDVMMAAFRTHPMHLGLVGNYVHRELCAPLSIIHATLTVGHVGEGRFVKGRFTVTGWYRFRDFD